MRAGNGKECMRPSAQQLLMEHKGIHTKNARGMDAEGTRSEGGKGRGRVVPSGNI
jgi:hypothetical protein